MSSILRSLWSGLWDGLSGSVPIVKYMWLVHCTKMEGRSSEEKRRARDLVQGIALCWVYNILVLLISLFFFILIDQVLLSIYKLIVRQSVLITSLIPMGQSSTSEEATSFDDTAQWWMFVSWLLLCTKEALWDIPVMLIGRACNFIWFRDIADCFPIVPRRSAEQSKLRAATASGSPKTKATRNDGLVEKIHSRFIRELRMVASGWFAVIVQLIFLVQAYVICGVPYVGMVLHYAHMALFHAWYSFDYRFAKESVDIKSAVHLLESSWPYCVGFGLPLSLITALSARFVALPSGAVFSICFPVLLVSAETLSSLPRAHQTSMALPILSPSYALANYIWSVIHPTPTSTPRPRPAS